MKPQFLVFAEKLFLNVNLISSIELKEESADIGNQQVPASTADVTILGGSHFIAALQDNATRELLIRHLKGMDS